MLTYPNMKHLWISILPRTIHKYHTPNVYKKEAQETNQSTNQRNSSSLHFQQPCYSRRSPRGHVRTANEGRRLAIGRRAEKEEKACAGRGGGGRRERRRWQRRRVCRWIARRNRETLRLPYISGSSWRTRAVPERLCSTHDSRVLCRPSFKTRTRSVCTTTSPRGEEPPALWMRARNTTDVEETIRPGER